MGFVDIGIILLLGYYMARGFLKGLWEESLAFLGLITAVMVALYGFEWGGDYLAQEHRFSSPLVYLVSPLGIFIGVLLLFKALRYFLAWSWGVGVPSFTSRIGGGFLSLLKGSFMVSLLLLTTGLLPLPNQVHDRMESSRMARTFRQVAPVAYHYFLHYLPSSAKERYNLLFEKVSPLIPPYSHFPKEDSRPEKASSKKGGNGRPLHKSPGI